MVVLKLKNKLIKIGKKLKIKDENMKRNKNYDRVSAKHYVEIYAEASNISDYPIFIENDCTNFISQALAAGGMIMEGQDYRLKNSWFCYTKDAGNLNRVSLSWRSARYFRRYWGNEDGFGYNKAKLYKEVTVQEAFENFEELYKFLEIGDVVQYGDPNNKNYPYHTQMIHAKEYNLVSNRNDLFVAQHSVNRKHVSLYEYLKLLRNKEERKIYIYHF